MHCKLNLKVFSFCIQQQDEEAPNYTANELSEVDSESGEEEDLVIIEKFSRKKSQKQKVGKYQWSTVLTDDYGWT